MIIKSKIHTALILYTFQILLCLFPLQISAQNKPDSTNNKKVKSYYILSVDTLVNFKLSVKNEEEWFVLEGDNFKYDIRPNFALKTSIGLSFKFFAGSFVFIPKFIPGNDDDELKGKSKAFQLKLNLFFEKWGQYLELGETQGYYLANTSDFNPSWKEGDPYTQFPDLKVQFLRGNTFYKFNPNFSFQAISSQAEIQTKSAGSFIAALDYSSYNIDNKSNDPKQQSSQRSQSLEGIFELGYFYTFVLNKKWFVSAGIMPGIGYGTTKLTTRYPNEQIISYYDNPVFRLKEAVGIGYNTMRIFSGCEIRLSQAVRNDNIPTVKLYSDRIAFQAYVGYRFGAPKIVKESVNYIEDKKPF